MSLLASLNIAIFIYCHPTANFFSVVAVMVATLASIQQLHPHHVAFPSANLQSQNTYIHIRIKDHHHCFRQKRIHISKHVHFTTHFIFGRVHQPEPNVTSHVTPAPIHTLIHIKSFPFKHRFISQQDNTFNQQTIDLYSCMKYIYVHMEIDNNRTKTKIVHLSVCFFSLSLLSFSLLISWHQFFFRKQTTIFRFQYLLLRSIF